MKNGVKGKVLEPTVEQVTAALRLCAVEEPAETYPCEQCYLYLYSKDGRMSTGSTCFDHLALDACQLINRLNDFQNSQCAKLLARISELESHTTAERARYAELQRYNVDCTQKCGGLLAKKIDLMDQLTESRRRERAAVEDLNGTGACFTCKHFRRNGGDCFGAGRCRLDGIEIWPCNEPGVYRAEVPDDGRQTYEWRGPQEAGEGGE